MHDNTAYPKLRHKTVVSELLVVYIPLFEDRGLPFTHVWKILLLTTVNDNKCIACQYVKTGIEHKCTVLFIEEID